MNIRAAAVADLFYPANHIDLARQVSDFMTGTSHLNIIPKALIVPHAGFIYSGSTAGAGYKLVQPLADTINKIVLIGPCHRVWVKGLAIPSTQYFETPLGKIAIDSDCLQQLLSYPEVCISDEAHLNEHSLEVQLPFLQSIFNDFKIIPLVVGGIERERLTEIIEYLWGDEHSLIVISSDLSHFLDYESAKVLDAKTSDAIEHFNPDLINDDMACGGVAIKALLQVAKEKHLQVKTIKQCNSGDTAGDKNRVVGYGTYAFY